MKFLPSNWRPTNGTPKQLARIAQLEAILARQEEANAREIAELTERLRDIEEAVVIARGLKAQRAERQAATLEFEAKRAELEAEISNIRRSVSAQAIAIAASAGVSEPLNIEGGSDALSLHARYTELKATDPRKARDFWNAHSEQIVSEIQNA